jgi:serine phosphatase RsbU (regulator of sigma subunit)
VERLQEAICGTGSLTAQDVCDLIFENVDQFQARAEQYDDMALLVMRASGETWSP